MIELKRVSKIYKAKKGIKTLALDNVSFSLPNKGLFFILGKSGSGKSTLLNILGGLDKYNSGEIIVDGKSTKKFKGKDFDYYRNTYIGFVFQEFNLLDEYNVYDNINLSRKLQKEKVSQTVIDDLLNKVGIVGLGKRRINELSGGQKQRVAIARALIKNPEIILADEPTGNLDAETGKQIFNLLKSISKEKLVIVVSHDRDSALAYADGIIEIADGKIVSNSIQLSSEENKNFKSKQSKLPFSASLNFAFANLGSHKIKLFFTILLAFMSIVFFGTSKILSKFEIEKSHAKAMVDNKSEYITLYKGVYNEENDLWYTKNYNKFYSDDIEKIDKLINNNYIYKYLLNEDNQLIQFDIDYNGNSDAITGYYLFRPTFLKFIEADSDFLNQKVIGTYPIANDEIMIHSYFADFIMRYGIMLYSDNPNQFKKEYYKPNSYEELLGDNKYIKFGSSKVKISGIIVDDTERFQFLKEIPYQEISQQESWLGIPSNDNKIYEFQETILGPATDIYVAKGFIKNLKLKPNSSINSSEYSSKIKFQNNYYSVNSTYRYLDKKIDIFDGEGISTVETLKEHEIIVSEAYLDKISKEEYTKLKEQYIQDYNEQKENDYKSEEELKLEFLKDYLKENNVIWSNVSLAFESYYNKKDAITLNNLKIVGIELDDNNIYIASGIADEIMEENYSICNILIKENSQKDLEKLFSLFPLDKAQYVSSTIYSNNIDSIYKSLNNLVPVAKYASYIFGFFAFILLTNFIVNSIYYNKKTIGILRGLGARKKDVFKIFLNEGLIIGVFSLILSITTLYIAIYITNNYISSHLFFHIDFIIFMPENLCIIIGSVLAIIFVSSLFTVRRIAKMNPVDAILNK